ncbi:MAG TPA: penicillin-binding protein 2, partial [Nitriliruptorales bacterium]
MTGNRSGATPRLRPPIPPVTRRLRRSLGPDGQHARILWAGLAMALLLLLVVGQLVRVQVVLGTEYQERGITQRQNAVELPTRRGRLYDRNGNILATDIDTVTVVVDPYFFGPQERADGTVVQLSDADRMTIAERLAPIVDRDPSWISERMLTPDSRFEYIRRQLPWSVREDLEAFQADNLLDGVHLLTEPVRDYPAGATAGQVLGFTGIDNNGLHGLEHHHEDVLVGTPGRVEYETAPGGLSIAAGERIVTEAEPGTDLVLTLDREIQWVAEQAAAAAVEEYDALGASVVVMEVGTGDVLAMANVPVLDPANPTAIDQDLWRNRAVTDVFEPGSVQKIVTAAAALEEGVVTPDTVFTVEDRWKVANKTFTDSHPHPTEELTFTQIIEESSNVGTIKVAQELGEERLGHWLEQFGYGQRTGVGFDAESPGILAPASQWWKTSLPTIAIGHGVAVTLVQTAQAYGTIANDGVLVTPRLVRGTVDARGDLVPADPSPSRRVASIDTAR